MARTLRWSALVVVASLFAATPAAFAGTQDFTLVNQTGIVIYSLYISETTNDEWEEDVLGENVLPNGESMPIEFFGRDACLWDLLITDGEDGEVTWDGINLCEASVVVLRCNDEECWADLE
jgi:hypothetical protein